MRVISVNRLSGSNFFQIMLLQLTSKSRCSFPDVRFLKMDECGGNGAGKQYFKSPLASWHFAATANQFKGKATMIFITRTLPKNLAVDEVVRIGHGALSAVG